ncbi:hypothetical protein MKW94_016771 [Papaver nudicaule]|uniref:25S rRNA (uridine-N(3))-methyltransferase BMT5-like domain-containing protein n=1 Tax=Papaver nudicaule TaxID=74823 RepID=A0AA42AQM2_PAPNU|nr:hypothetical protein [Papaver nudicaule]
MLRPFGEVHINHKTGDPFDKWDLENLGRKHNLALVKRVEFKQEDYPGYKNKRGSGRRCNELFRLGKCDTFMFEFKKSAQPRVRKPPPFEPRHLTAFPQNQRVQPPTHNPTRCTRHQFQLLPSQPQNRVVFDGCYPLPEMNMPSNLRYFGSPYAPNVSERCYRIFHEYFADIEKAFGKKGYHVGRGVHETLKTGFDRYMIETKERNVAGYRRHLEELHRVSASRSEWLNGMLHCLDK